MPDFRFIQPGQIARPDAPRALPEPVRRSDTFGRYVFSDEAATALNVAIHLGRPLLVTGEPGTGKTALAWGAARQLGAGAPLEFHTKSSSIARDLFYSIDDLARFHDASVHEAKARDASHYLRWHALGEAIRSDASRVVLIDEIDKAPREFPNDLLNELDRMQFAVPELGPDARFTASAAHVIIITSNSERRLPAPFLRRCVYHHVQFPDAALLEQIVALHTEGLSVSEGIRTVAVQRFVQLRQIGGLSKRPSTDELIAWVRVLEAMGVDVDALQNTPIGELPGMPVLVKSNDDLELVRRA